MLHLKREMKTNLKPVEEEDKTTKDKLPWRSISFRSAQQKYRFKIFSRRVGASAKYCISQKELQFPWTSISQEKPPPNTSFEEAKTKDFLIIRICRFGVEEDNGRIKILRK